MRLVAATGNRGKLRELRALLPGFELVAQDELDVVEIAETGLSFVENAILKARNAARKTGLPAIGEDSGLEVDALDGAPGIYSARYAGAGATDDDNNAKLLAALLDHEQSSARYRCVAVVMRREDDPSPLICSGAWEGKIVREPRGRHGFGYDPLFQPEGFECTAAELEPAEKNRLSHRSRAIASLAARLPEFLSLR